MKKLFLYLIPLCIGAVCLNACQEDDEEHDEEAVTINIVSPDESTRENGDTVHIHVEWTGPEVIHNVAVRMTHVEKDSVIYEYVGHVHADESYTHEDDFVLEVHHHTNILFEAETWEHDENEKTVEQLTFHTHPG